jgi:hypothetical protein
VADCLHWQVAVAVARSIIGLGLEDIGSRVYVCEEPDDTAGYDTALDKVTDVKFPCVQVSFRGVIEEKGDGNTQAREWIWPVLVWVCDRENARRHDRSRVYLNARKAILDLFDDGDGLAGVDEAQATSVNPQVIFDRQLPGYMHVVSGVIVRTETAELRG